MIEMPKDDVLHVLISGDYPLETGGVYTGPMRVVRELSHALAALDRIRVTVLRPRRMRSGFGRLVRHRYGDVEVLEMPYLPERWPAAREIAGDVLSVHGVSVFNSLCGRRGKKRWKVPVVYTAHGLAAMERKLGYKVTRSALICEKKLIERSDAVTSVTEDTRRKVLRCYSPKSGRVEVIGNGVDIDYFSNQAGSKLKSSENASLKLLFVGDPVPAKGLPFLFKALSMVKKDVCRLEIVGRKSPYLEEWRTEFSSLFASGQVCYSGPAGQEELKNAYTRNDLFILPSMYDQCPQVLLEAMAMGLPVLVSERVGSRDIVRPGENGFLIPYGDAPHLADLLARLRKNRSLLVKMEKKARDTAELYSWNRVAELYREFFAKIARA
jgi:glycosyltransferase involved in cell wall biosynthesis